MTDPQTGDLRTAEDEAFDQAFREAAERELSADVAVPLADVDEGPRLASPELLERRAAYRKMVLWIVGSAGALMAIGTAVGLMT